MLISELIEILSKLPGDAQVYSVSDHGQCPEQAGSVSVCVDDDQPYDGEELEWESMDDVEDLSQIKSVVVG